MLTMQLGAGYLLFCGLMAIAKETGVQRGLKRVLKPLLRGLMPSVQKEETQEAVLLSLAMNVLGLGNASTPAGVEAMRRMEAERELCPAIRHDMEMLLILNATGLQLLPTTVLTLRAAAGSVDVNAVLIPVLMCTAFSTVAGVGMGLIMRRWEERKHA